MRRPFENDDKLGPVPRSIGLNFRRVLGPHASCLPFSHANTSKERFRPCHIRRHSYRERISAPKLRSCRVARRRDHVKSMWPQTTHCIHREGGRQYRAVFSKTSLIVWIVCSSVWWDVYAPTRPHLMRSRACDEYGGC